ncbi:hypothetical protein L195_g005143 [Trifolium pratense]|uniref:Uncharacterized protein n=1 Tax=Trifolium pratense TaxID=57577 RepID=A0A2K3NZZ1_TRIPR|nr:hypothetical protein L195_g005143 [Trifolium pratense]
MRMSNFKTTISHRNAAQKGLDGCRVMATIAATGPECNRPVIQEAEQCWCKPRPGTLKCNVDAACYAEANQFFMEHV